ncbi:hypothetical protein [Variovorax soli]|uniref:Uncharacterized protein n=1 Tax=Variovorax soli TaxID=376815 RepID=A0ABU1NCF4_9BURK|nr:hypothetical protein [Variovorax soli]MDR6536023.1 hypothetical protein [Variovorax soli]
MNSLSQKIAFSPSAWKITLKDVPGHGQLSAPIHSLKDVKEVEPPYTKDDISRYLHDHEVCEMGEGTFDNGSFQCMLNMELFDKIEKGEIQPGQPEHDRPACYLLKKSVELLQPLGIKISEANQRYKNLLQESSLGSPLHTKLEQQVGFITSMVERLSTLERNLLDVLVKPGDFRPTRDKACFLLFVHAMLADAANQTQKWMNELDDVEAEKVAAPWTGSIFSYVTGNEMRSNLFSPEPLTPADMTLYENCLCRNDESDPEVVKNSVIPSALPRGAQGLVAMLYAVSHGKVLLSAAIDKPYSFHDNLIMGSFFALLTHEDGHLDFMLNETPVLTHIAQKLKPIFVRILDPECNLSAMNVKRDLVVLHYMLHESPTFEAMLRPPPNSKSSFLERVRNVFNKDFWVADAIPLLNKSGFLIPRIDQTTPRKAKEACYEEVAKAMNTLWGEFRERHVDSLKASGLISNLPRFFED